MACTVVLLVAFMEFCVFMAGFSIGRKGMLSEAVSHGAARWTANQETGEAEFKWNDEEPTHVD